MPYRDMARDAGYDPDTDEGRQVAEMIEAEAEREAEMESHQQVWEAEQEWEAEQRAREEDEIPEIGPADVLSKEL